MRLAYLASSVTLPGSPNRRSDAFEHDWMMDAVGAGWRGLLGATAVVEALAWDDPSVDWSGFDAVVVGTTWDYGERRQEFVAALRRIESATRVFNSASMIEWNTQKTYLRDLEARGARLIPTLWLDPTTGPEPDWTAAFDQLGSDDLVVKRQVGAGAEGQSRIRRGDAWPKLEHPMMVQPYLAAVEQEGEYSFIFIDGKLSHALIKRPAAGDYRVQAIYGGVEEAIEPTVEELEQAASVIASLADVPLYARVDMVRGERGELLLMELELIEPYLYPKQGPQLGQRLADAVVKRIARTT